MNIFGGYDSRLGQWFRQRPAWLRRVLVSIVILFVVSQLGDYALLTLPAFCYFWYVFIRETDKAWLEGYPSLEEYWRRFPHTRTKAGTRCYYCGANRIESYAWNSYQSRRVHYCHQCRRELYRTLSVR